MRQALGVKMNWALLTWFPEHGIEKIHPDDIAIFSNGIQGHVVKVVHEDNIWATVYLVSHVVRVSPSLLKPCSEPAFKIGDVIKTIPPRTERNGSILAITWHLKQNEPIFYIESDGKQIKARYFARELQSIA